MSDPLENPFIPLDEPFTNLGGNINDYLIYSTNAFLNAHGRPLEEPEEMQQVLDALLELHDFEPSTHTTSQAYDMNYLSIINAIDLNEQLQSQVKQQIEAIDQLLEQTEEHMKEASHSAIKENRFGQKFTIHKLYEDSIQYFDSSELLSDVSQDVSETTPEVEEEQIGREDMLEEELDPLGDLVPQRKSWTTYERDRLIEGIHSEAKRMISFDHMKRNEAWRVWEVDQMENRQLELFPVSRIDWTRISQIHVRTRSPTECLIQWTTQEHPSINKKPWTRQESQRLSELVEEIGLFSGQWERIANALNTNRTISQCFAHYMAAKNNQAARSLKWNPEEDIRLREAVKIFGTCNWQLVASILKGRTGQQCLHRWTKSLNPAIRRTRWTPEEDRLLARAVSLYGVGNWTKIQRLIPQRTDMQCRERWVNQCHPDLNKTNPATEEEIGRIVQLVRQHGPKWSLIARSLPGRTDNFAMRVYNSWLKKQKSPAEQKKRGRKPGSKNKVKVDQDNIPNQQKRKMSDDVDNIPKKRGRKPGSKNRKGTESNDDVNK